MDDYLTTSDIARLLKVNHMTVRRWINSGKLPAIDLGRGFRVSKAAFEKFLDERQVGKRKE